MLELIIPLVIVCTRVLMEILHEIIGKYENQGPDWFINEHNYVKAVLVVFWHPGDKYPPDIETRLVVVIFGGISILGGVITHNLTLKQSV